MFCKNKFKAQMALLGITQKELSKRLGISETTLYRKVQRNGDFSRQEINDMIQILKIDDPKEIFFANELTET